MFAAVVAALAVFNRGVAAVVYTDSQTGETFDTATCEHLDLAGLTAAQQECCLNEPILASWPETVDNTMGQSAHICALHKQTCMTVPAYQDNSAECTTVFDDCRSALRHLHEMMFKPEGQAQVCNNFARKSIRGFFHDFMSNGIDGSILAEHHVSMNFGLCRWAQYVNVLSDHTQCDAGSIIAMGGMIGYEACGVPLWEIDIAVKPEVNINRPHACGPNIADAALFDPAIGQRSHAFSDMQLSSNATAMEEHWYTANWHFDRPDGEAEYSAEAGAAAHAIGRVTCPAEGRDVTGMPNPHTSDIGFFHKARSSAAETDVKAFYLEAINKMSDTQCEDVGGQLHPTQDGNRPSHPNWPHVEGETTLNPEGGFCSMPTQFLGTVNVGSLHRTPRWVSTTENAAQKAPDWSTGQGECQVQMEMYIPTELLTLDSVTLPTSAALQQFVDIAWDGVDSIDSAWDSCEVGCEIPIDENSLCGGGGLSAYDFELPYCNDGIVDGAFGCCSASCGTCAQDGGSCSGRTGGAEECCPDTIEATARPCKSSWDSGCAIPKAGDGGQCSADGDCKSGSCKGGRCCNLNGQHEGCAECGIAGGKCVECGAGWKTWGQSCIDECYCSDGCTDCDCGLCSACDDTAFLDGDGMCNPKRSPGAMCDDNEQCLAGNCRGGNCCDMDLLEAGCTECNERGLCDACSSDYTLCGHTGSNYGQCTPTAADEQVIAFVCGTGGPDSDFPSTDGYDYCGMANNCPCDDSGCYRDCEIKKSCWDISIASGLTDFAPPWEDAPSGEETEYSTDWGSGSDSEDATVDETETETGDETETDTEDETETGVLGSEDPALSYSYGRGDNYVEDVETVGDAALRAVPVLLMLVGNYWY